MSKIKSPLVSFLLTVLVIAFLALFGPEEKSLGSNVRIVYLHGAWVLTADAAFALAALAGLFGLAARRDIFHSWSSALGRTGIVFWVTYLPLSLFAMQTNWNGILWVEPRLRLAMTFAVTGVLLQAGLWVINQKWISSLANLAFFIVLRVVFATAENIMHPPPSPIFSSGNYVIITFFIGLNLLAWVAAYFLTIVFLSYMSEKPGA